MYNHNKAQQSKNRVHISWDILYASPKQNRCDFLVSLYVEIWHRHLIVQFSANSMKVNAIQIVMNIT